MIFPATQCDCCATMNQYITNHYDPTGCCRRGDEPSEVLRLFLDCFPDEDNAITLSDIESYLATCPE